jgi:hypothetical protein
MQPISADVNIWPSLDILFRWSARLPTLSPSLNLIRGKERSDLFKILDGTGKNSLWINV